MILDADVDALGALASALRARGLTVLIASEIFDAVEAAFQKGAHAMLVARELDSEGDVTEALQAVPQLIDLPVLYLLPSGDTTPSSEMGPRDVRRTEPDVIASKVLEMAPRAAMTDSAQELRGNIKQMSPTDLLQLLTMNQRSGTLQLVTPSGTGEVRLVGGQIVDATYRRLEGEKALFRLLGEHEGSFVFSPGASAATSIEAALSFRIQTSTSALLMEAMRQLDELTEKRRALSPASEVFVADGPTSRSPSQSGSSRPGAPGFGADAERLESEVLSALQVPRSLDELCDEVPWPDLAVANMLGKLLDSGLVQAVPLATLTARLAQPEQLPVLRALLARLTPPGFALPPRVVIAATMRKLAGLSHAVRYIADAVPPPDLPPRVPVPRPLGTLRLGENVDLALVGLPTDDSFAPLWAMTLAGAAAVVRVDAAGGVGFEAVCADAEVTLFDAERLLTNLDTTSPERVAALVRVTLEAAAGV